MSVFIASIAFIVALGALWFTSEVAKRIEMRNTQAVKPHLMPVNKALTKAESQIRDLTHSLEVAEREIRLLKTLQSDAVPSMSPSDVNSGSTENIITLPAGYDDRGQQPFRPTGTYDA